MPGDLLLHGAGTILVIDIGGTGIKIGYVCEGRPTGYQVVFPTRKLRDGDPVIGLAGMIETAIAESGLRPGQIVATVPGFIDLDFDHVLTAANVPALNGRALASELSGLVGCPVFLERDSILLLSGEVLAGGARGCGSVLGMFFGTGIGTAYLQDGRPFRGGGWALELGLMPFRGDGRVLSGMRTDCLEAYCSGRVLQDIASRHGLAVEDVFVTADAKPSLAEELATFILYQAFAVGCAVAMVSPRTILLGGGIVATKGFPRDRLTHLVAEHAPIAETGRSMDLRWAELGWTATLHGAPRVAAEHRARHPGLLGDS
jgi:predicted NBD/HSP70 family sugar kinase